MDNDKSSALFTYGVDLTGFDSPEARGVVIRIIGWS